MRHERLATALRDNGCDAALLVGHDHATHLTGWAGYLGGLPAVVTTVDGACTLLVPRLEAAAAESSTAAAVVGYGEPHQLDFHPVPALVREAFATLGHGRLGVAAPVGVRAAVTASLAGRDIVPLDDVVAGIRMVKDDDEVALIRESRSCALAAHEAIAALLATGPSEIELASAAFAAAQNAAGQPIEFGTGILSGPRTADICPPIAVQGARRPAAGEPVLADLWVRRGGYWADTTRTYVVGENDEVHAVKASLEQIQQRCALQLRPGVPAETAYAIIRGAILDEHPDGWFEHHAGHGLGLSVGEDPQLIPGVDTRLATGMVLALEPAVYFRGRFGVRVEDVFVVTERGAVPIGSA